MRKLLCKHELQYCYEKKSKFFQTGFGKLVVTRPGSTLQEYFNINKSKVYVFRNRGVSKKRHEEIVSNSHVPPFAVDIEDKDYSGELGVFWT